MNFKNYLTLLKEDIGPPPWADKPRPGAPKKQKEHYRKALQNYRQKLKQALLKSDHGHIYTQLPDKVWRLKKRKRQMARRSRRVNRL